MLGRLNNLKIGTKLQVLLWSVSAITIAVGVTTYWGIGRTGAAVDDIGLEALPSVQSLMVLKANANQIKSNQRTLLGMELSVEMRQRQYANVAKAREEYEAAWKIYDALPQVPEEAEAWKQFVAAWQSWRNDNEEFFRVSHEFDAMLKKCPGAQDPKFSLGNTLRLAADRSEEALVTFKTQVQEWKNILIRGSAAADFDKHLAAFQKEEAAVQSALTALKPMVNDVGLDAQLIETLAKTHAELGIKYRAALKGFDKSNPEAGKLVDKAVRGLDRPTAAALEAVSQAIAQKQSQVQSVAATLSDQATRVCFASQTKACDLLDKVIQISNDLGEIAVRNGQVAASRAKLILVIGSIAGLLVGLALNLVIGRSIATPIARTAEHLEGVARGNLKRDVPEELLQRKDECGTLARGLAAMVTSLRKIIGGMTDNSRSLANASTELAATATQLATGAEETTNQSTQVAAAAEQMSANMNTMAASSEQMSANVKVVAAAVEELTASISEVARSAEQAASVAQSAAQLAGTSNAQIGELGTAADQIGKVIDVIQDIAEQTNLLALNATIEAARAGEAGKGFAVVATEVKELARQTAGATEDIRKRIEGIQASSSQAVRSIGDISGVIEKVNELSRTIASAVEEQSITTKEIAKNVAESSTVAQSVAKGVAESATASQEITRTIASVDQAAKQSAEGASHTQTAGHELSQMAEQFQSLVGQFSV